MPIEAWDRHDPAALDPAALTSAYLEAIRTCASDTDDGDGINSDEMGRDTTLETAVTVLAPHSELDAAALRLELLDRLLIGMTNAVMDVDVLAQETSLELSPKEFQQRIEGRVPMTIEEFAHIRHAIAVRTPE